MSRGVSLLGQCNQSMYSVCPGQQLSSALLQSVAKSPTVYGGPGETVANMSNRMNQEYNEKFNANKPIGDYSHLSMDHLNPTNNRWDNFK